MTRLWGILKASKVAWHKGIKQLYTECDSILAVQLSTHGCNQQQPRWNMVHNKRSSSLTLLISLLIKCITSNWGTLCLGKLTSYRSNNMDSTVLNFKVQTWSYSIIDNLNQWTEHSNNKKKKVSIVRSLMNQSHRKKSKIQVRFPEHFWLEAATQLPKVHNFKLVTEINQGARKTDLTPSYQVVISQLSQYLARLTKDD